MSNADTAASAGPQGRRRVSLLRQLRSVWFDTATTGSSFPAETELVERFGASRSMVREALVRLEAEGLIQRRPGSGTFANASALGMPFRIDQSFEFTEMLSAAGYQPGLSVLSSGEITLDQERAERFGVAPGTAAFTATKLWRADGTPVMVAHDLVPVRAQAPAPGRPGQSVFDLARALGHEEVEWETARVAPCAAPGTEAELLGVAAGHSRPPAGPGRDLPARRPGVRGP